MKAVRKIFRLQRQKPSNCCWNYAKIREKRKQTVKANPRPAVIYVTGGAINESYEKLEELKKYCADNKVVFLCPKATDVEELAKTYQYAVGNFKKLNIVPEEISVKSDDDHTKQD